jgi:class 3 adenylate cyclase/tetratricopeptide (TPR) repeat protein
MAEDLPVNCTACGHVNPDAARFCNDCGASLAGVAPAEAAERKQVSVLFSDLTGFTALSERLDPEETREIMGRVFERAAAVVARYEGRLEKFIGDAIMAIFGVPAAHEDDPVRAVRAALELHEAVAELSSELEARLGAPIALHSGINTGLVVTGELRFDHGTAGPLGETINLAARLMNEAPSGEIWVGPETRELVRDAFELEELGGRTFKGKSEPIAVARVRGAAARKEGAGRFRGAFVGRQAELGALLGAAERMRDGVSSVFGIRGDAGTGKTRLVEEFHQRLGDDVRWLEGRAYPYAAAIPYAPILDLLSRSLSIEENDKPAEVREKLEGGLAALLDDAAEVLPLYLHLYHLEQDEGVVIEREAFQERLRDAMYRVLAALAARGPLVVCLQDLHWADASSQILLRRLLREPDIPMVFVANFRPGYEAPETMQVFDLEELSPRQTRELLTSILEAEPPRELVRFIEERSDGNPFYVEEVVHTLLETNLLTPVAGEWRLAGPLSEAAVPATVRGVIAARIDRLDDSRRRVLRHAAVVGREFLHSVVAELTGEADELDPSLGELMAVDLIRPIEPDVEYIFKHALTQEVAYDGLLHSERQKLHERVAYAMEGVLGDRIPEFVETLAYHFERGGVVDKAVHYLTVAGRKCVARYALDEAASQFQRAYDLLAEHERAGREAMLTELLVEWSLVFYYRAWIADWIRLLEKHRPEAERCPNPGLKAMYLGWLGNVRVFHGDARGSLESLERALTLGQECGDRTAVAYATAWLTHTLVALGRVDEARRCGESYEQTDRERLEHPYPYLKARGGLASSYAGSGRHVEALAIARELIEFGQALGNTRCEAMGHAQEAFCLLLLLDFERAMEAADRAIASTADVVFKTNGVIFKGLALLMTSRFQEADELLAAWLPEMERNEDRFFGDMGRGIRAPTDAALGDLSNGMRAWTALIGDYRDREWLGHAFMNEAGLVFTYVSTARMDLNPGVAALLRNPWFVFTQAPFAARKARRLIEKLRLEAERLGGQGFGVWLDFFEARLLSHQKKKDEAHALLGRIRSTLREAGVEREPEAIAALAAEVGAPRA